MRRIRTDKARAGDLIAGTWADDWTQPRRLAADPTPAPEHSTTGPAYRLSFTDQGPDRVLYGSCDLLLAQRP